MELRNPVLCGFNPDPSIVRVGSDYFLATSSFEYLPGLPIYTSQDLRSWRLIGHVATRPGQLDVAGVPTGAGAWAPTIRHHDDRFWLVITVVGQGCLVYTAEDAAGPWSDPVVFDGILGIDPDIAWDADGTCFLTFSGLMVAKGMDGGSSFQHLGIQQARVNPYTGEVLEAPRSLWSGTGGMFPEAPHLYQIGDFWYLMVAEGGTERGHSIAIARANSPQGPFEGYARNPILTARGTSRPVQNTGHGDLVQTVDGEWLVFCLGVRTRSMTRAFSPMGRETFVSRVTWRDGWPSMEPITLPADVAPAVSLRDEFDATQLPGWYLGIRRFVDAFASLTERPGWLTIHGEGRTMAHVQPTAVAARQRHERMCVSTFVDVADGVGGLAVRIDEHQWAHVVAGNGEIRARVQLHQIAQELAAPLEGTQATLFVRAADPSGDGAMAAASGPDTVVLGYIADGAEVPLLQFDGRYICAETGESFVGRAYALVANEGTVAFDWLQYDGVDAPRP